MRAALPFLLLLAACAPPAIVPVVQTASVTADAETAAVKSGDDAADDPAIWRNAANPAASLIVGTDKQAGLYVYGLDDHPVSWSGNVLVRAGPDSLV